MLDIPSKNTLLADQIFFFHSALANHHQEILPRLRKWDWWALMEQYQRDLESIEILSGLFQIFDELIKHFQFPNCVLLCSRRRSLVLPIYVHWLYKCTWFTTTSKKSPTNKRDSLCQLAYQSQRWFTYKIKGSLLTSFNDRSEDWGIQVTANLTWNLSR